MAIDLSADIIDVRDIIERFEELETESRELVGDDGDELEGEYLIRALQKADHHETSEELQQLSAILEDLRGNGGDEQWRGDWYPLSLIRGSHFEDHARELAEDCGLIKGDATWPNNCIDWEEAARQLQWDYSSVDIGEETYWYR